MQDILTSGQYLLDVINDILDMSKIEAGRFKLDLEPLDLANTVSVCSRVRARRNQERHAEGRSPRQDPRGGDIAVAEARSATTCSRPSNAASRSRPWAARSRCGRAGWKIRSVRPIADTGIGIAPQSLARLGRPFEQVENELSKSYHGSGLGLAIAKSLTKLHGGSMRLRSARVRNRRDGLPAPQHGASQRRAVDGGLVRSATYELPDGCVQTPIRR